MDRSVISGGLVGLLVGDALGVPYEFHHPSTIPPADEIDFHPPAGFERSHRGVPPGTWSDDGAHALCLLASLLHCGKFDARDFGQRLVDWYRRGYLAVDRRVFDVGITSATAIRSIESGVPATDAGPTGERDNGNGSLMRVLPLALWHRGADEALVADAHAQSRVTHGHPRSQVCCALYSLWARRTMQKAHDPWAEAVKTLRVIYEGAGILSRELEVNIRPDDLSPGHGTGYVVDCLRSARSVVARGNYEQVVRAAITLGNDTDTTACVAGGIAGLRDGIEGIPERWRSRLRGKDLLEPVLDKLCEWLT